MAKISKKDINFYSQLASPTTTKIKTGAIVGVAAIVMVVLMIGGYVGLKVYNTSITKQIDDLQVKMEDQVLAEKISKANDVASEISILRTAGDAYSQVRTEINENQRYVDDFSDTLNEQLLSCENYTSNGKTTRVATIEGYSYDDEILTITATSTDSACVSFFVSNINKLGLFESVTYSGYEVEEDEESGTSVYNYTVDAVFLTHDYTETEEETTADGSTETTEEVTD